MAAAVGTEAVKFRRCTGCRQLYQKGPTVYAVAQRGGTLDCGKCGATVWYPADGGGTCVSCWSCQHVNAFGSIPVALPVGERRVLSDGSAYTKEEF
eukprot:gene24797-39105_t